jgi:hypothetical protein
VLGFVEEVRDGRRVATDTPREYEVELATEFEPALEISRPFAYAIPERLEAVVVNLAHHGVSVEVLRQPIETEVEVYRISSIERAAREFEGHRLVTVEASAASRSETLPAGSLVVRTAQPLGALAAYLLEPQAADGLVAWNFFDADLAEGGEFPVLRLSRPRELPLAPLPRRRENEQRIEKTPAAERPGF